MFTEQDMRDYLESILSLEEKSLSFTEKFLSRLTDEDVKKEIEKISKDEAEHISVCRRLLASLSE